MANILQMSAEFSVDYVGVAREFRMTVSEQSPGLWDAEVEDLRTGEEWPTVRFKWGSDVNPVAAHLALQRAVSLFEMHLNGGRPWESN